MNIDQALGQIRPITAVIGTIMIVAGIAEHFGFDIPVRGSGLELAVAGFLLKHV